jgi:hypothetical protein
MDSPFHRPAPPLFVMKFRASAAAARRKTRRAMGIRVKKSVYSILYQSE